MNDEPVRKAVQRAYRDFNRTLTGFGMHPDRLAVRQSAATVLQQRLTKPPKIVSQEEYDSWHEAVCRDLQACYADFTFTVGQAQKWLNMTVKYLFVLHRSLIEESWPYCHVPVDQILLRQLRDLGHSPPPVGAAWSRLDNYPQYLHFQKWFRDTFPGAPMDNEFELWMRPSSFGA